MLYPLSMCDYLSKKEEYNNFYHEMWKKYISGKADYNKDIFDMLQLLSNLIGTINDLDTECRDSKVISEIDFLTGEKI